MIAIDTAAGVIWCAAPLVVWITQLIRDAHLASQLSDGVSGDRDNAAATILSTRVRTGASKFEIQVYSSTSRSFVLIAAATAVGVAGSPEAAAGLSLVSVLLLFVYSQVTIQTIPNARYRVATNVCVGRLRVSVRRLSASNPLIEYRQKQGDDSAAQVVCVTEMQELELIRARLSVEPCIIGLMQRIPTMFDDWRSAQLRAGAQVS